MAFSDAYEVDAAANKHRPKAMCLKFMDLTIAAGKQFVKAHMRIDLKKLCQASDG
jgi:hypothetical protein